MYGCIDVWPNLSGKACVQLLEKIATQDMEDIIQKVEERMEDEDEHVRDSAYYALEAGQIPWFLRLKESIMDH
eukprot:symbB.v1.2.026682.t1/scaffold2603.1/size75102/2